MAQKAIKFDGSLKTNDGIKAIFTYPKDKYTRLVRWTIDGQNVTCKCTFRDYYDGKLYGKPRHDTDVFPLNMASSLINALGLSYSTKNVNVPKDFKKLEVFVHKKATGEWVKKGTYSNDDVAGKNGKILIK